jgi:diguanylate cyclase (GGDEF)-like protein
MEQRVAVVAALDDARSYILFSATQVVAAVFSQNTIPLTSTFDDARTTIAGDLSSARAGLDAMGETDQVARVDAVSAQMQAYEGAIGTIVNLGNAPAGETRVELAKSYVPAMWPQFETTVNDLAQLGQDQQVKLSAERAAAGRAADTSLGLLLGLSTLAFIIAAGTLIFLVGSVVRPLEWLQEGAKAVASGDLDAKVKVAGPEEVTSLAKAFNLMVEERRQAEETLRHLAATDSLTSLFNHRALQDTLAREVERSLCDGLPLAVIMMDIDGFKLFNDTYGHQEGDRVLKQTARVLKEEFGCNGVIGRYGGDEFMAILPDTDRESAVRRANEVLEVVARERVQPRQGSDLPLVLSMGLAVCPDDSRHKEELVAYADASLFEAKEVAGSSLVIAHHEATDSLSTRRTPFGVLDALVRAVDAKDSYTRHHSQQNAEFAVQLGKVVGLSEGALNALRIGGLLHDVGKIGVPDDILRKPGPLTPEEQEIMREHVILSNLIVHGVPNLQDVSDAVYGHHERWDGTGYPRGLKGNEIPLPGRIMALVDAYSAMILDRPYRKALSHDEAVAELRRCTATQFDPELVEPFIRLLETEQRVAA